MPKSVTCVCGQHVQILDEFDPFPTNCPACGAEIDLKHEISDDSPLSEEIPDSCFIEERVSEKPTAELPLLLRMLLDPNTIQRLLFFGGGLSVLGLIAWLISSGVFDDPKILAVTLGAGTLALMSSGWAVALRTKHRLAGQALTFLACVVAPLNLWFYDAQNLLTIDGHLWVGGLICSVLYLITVWKLRDPLFLYAAEAGITLTVLLLLGDLHCSTDSSALCVAMAVLAAISIHAEAAFNPNDPIFSRRKFGLPLFFSGQVQLATGTISLLILQMLNWVWKPLVHEWSHSHLATTPWLAGTIWLGAAYLWLYSDLAVRRLSIYTALAAVALVLAEITLLSPYVPVEILIITLSLTSVAALVLTNRIAETNLRWSSIASFATSVIAAIAFVLGVTQHIQQFSVFGVNAVQHHGLLSFAMISVTANLYIQGRFRKDQTESMMSACWAAAGFSLWLGLTHGLSTINVLGFVNQVPLLMAVPVGLILATRQLKNREHVNSTVIAAHVMAVAGIFVSWISVSSYQEWSQFLNTGSHELSTLFAGITMIEAAILYLATPTRNRAHSILAGCGILCTLGAFWKLLVYVDLPEACYSPLLAGTGFALTLIERFNLLRWARTDDETTTKPKKTVQGSLSNAGNLILVLGQLIAFFQTLPWLLGTREDVSVFGVLAVLLTVGITAVSTALSSSSSISGWHRFVGAMTVGSLTLGWIRTQHLADYQKLEIVVELLGLAWLGAGISGRLHETEQKKEDWVSVALWAGSLTATLPVMFCMLMHRWSITGPSLADELALITITVLMVAAGCVLQIRSTTTLGGLSLGIYLAVLFGHLAYHPQITVGVYLAAGGAAIFLTGVILSIYRDRLLALPAQIVNREGVFRMIDWR